MKLRFKMAKVVGGVKNIYLNFNLVQSQFTREILNELV